MSELRCEAVQKSFGGTRSLVHVTCSFVSGTATALIGPNGAGKTTLLNVISGFLRPDSGRVLLNGEAIVGVPPYRVAARGIGRTFQTIRLPLQMSVIDNVIAAATVAGDDTLFRAILGLPSRRRAEIECTAREALAFVELASYARNATGVLSYGQQKLLAIAACIAGGRRILLLDEPFAGVHPELINRLVAKLRVLVSQAYTVVIVEHDLAAVREVADYTVALAHGMVIGDGATAGVLQSDAVRGAFLAG